MDMDITEGSEASRVWLEDVRVDRMGMAGLETEGLKEWKKPRKPDRLCGVNSATASGMLAGGDDGTSVVTPGRTPFAGACCSSNETTSKYGGASPLGSCVSARLRALSDESVSSELAIVSILLLVCTCSRFGIIRFCMDRLFSLSSSLSLSWVSLLWSSGMSFGVSGCSGYIETRVEVENE